MDIEDKEWKGVGSGEQMSYGGVRWREKKDRLITVNRRGREDKHMRIERAINVKTVYWDPTAGNSHTLLLVLIRKCG